MPIVSYMIWVIITALHTKFEASSFYSSWEILDKKSNIGLYREKKEWKNTWTNKPRKSLTRCKSSLLLCIPSLQRLACIAFEKSLTKIFYKGTSMERKENITRILTKSGRAPPQQTYIEWELCCKNYGHWIVHENAHDLDLWQNYPKNYRCSYLIYYPYTKFGISL